LWRMDEAQVHRPEPGVGSHVQAGAHAPAVDAPLQGLAAGLLPDGAGLQGAAHVPGPGQTGGGFHASVVTQAGQRHFVAGQLPGPIAGEVLESPQGVFVDRTG
ncbi:hypothetical protein RZS08_57535, partial [Arthrospira platensis SPKY1]|nr:hypothetical protein [Arthrospira platensis SPKY1]